MSASDIEVGDTVMCYGMNIGKVVDKFLSETGEKVYDIKARLWAIQGSSARSRHRDQLRTKG
jgi:hypothetical protein